MLPFRAGCASPAKLGHYFYWHSRMIIKYADQHRNDIVFRFQVKSLPDLRDPALIAFISHDRISSQCLTFFQYGEFSYTFSAS